MGMSEVGTLKELDVKPGDVVEYWYKNRIWVKGVIDDNEIAQMENGLDQNKKYSTDPNWRIISRADNPKLWRDMTDAEKGALLLAKHEGKVIECYDGYMWFETVTPRWYVPHAYRIRPEPKVETVTVHYQKDGATVMPVANGYTHRITFNTIDGKPDTASIKMEAI
jgi:hypothetical protein